MVRVPACGVFCVLGNMDKRIKCNALKVVESGFYRKRLKSMVGGACTKTTSFWCILFIFQNNIVSFTCQIESFYLK